MNIVFDKFWVMPNYLTSMAFEKEKHLRVNYLEARGDLILTYIFWIRDDGSFPSLDGTGQGNTHLERPPLGT